MDRFTGTMQDQWACQEKQRSYKKTAHPARLGAGHGKMRSPHPKAVSAPTALSQAPLRQEPSPSDATEHSIKMSAS